MMKGTTLTKRMMSMNVSVREGMEEAGVAVAGGAGGRERAESERANMRCNFCCCE